MYLFLQCVGSPLSKCIVHLLTDKLHSTKILQSLSQSTAFLLLLLILVVTFTKWIRILTVRHGMQCTTNQYYVLQTQLFIMKRWNKHVSLWESFQNFPHHYQLGANRITGNSWKKLEQAHRKQSNLDCPPAFRRTYHFLFHDGNRCRLSCGSFQRLGSRWPAGRRQHQAPCHSTQSFEIFMASPMNETKLVAGHGRGGHWPLKELAPQIIP
jgi:hypothetical protein